MIFFLRLCQLFADVYKNCKMSCSSQYVLVGLTFHIFRLVFAGEPVSILHQQPFFAVQLILARSALLSQQTKEAALTSKNSTSQHDSLRIFWITPNGRLCNPSIEASCYCLKCATFPPCHHSIAVFTKLIPFIMIHQIFNVETDSESDPIRANLPFNLFTL